jgi:hypothetical protein
MSCDICGKNNCIAAFHSVGRQQAYDDAINSDKSNLLSEIAVLREQLKDCSAAFDRQQEQLDRNQEKEDSGTTHWAGCSESGPKHYKCALLEIGRLRLTITDLREKLEAAGQEVEVQKAKAEKHYELGIEYFDLMVKAEREIAGLQKLLKKSATYIVDYPLIGQRDRIFLNQIDAALNKIDAVITATEENK